MNLSFQQLQNPEHIKMVQIIDSAGSAWSVGDAYDLLLTHPLNRETQVHLLRLGSGPVLLWAGPTPQARRLVLALLRRVSDAAGGEVISVEEVAEKVAEADAHILQAYP
jgi:hypothetical protein